MVLPANIVNFWIFFVMVLLSAHVKSYSGLPYDGLFQYLEWRDWFRSYRNEKLEIANMCILSSGGGSTGRVC